MRDITIIGVAETNIRALAEAVITKALVLLHGADSLPTRLVAQEWPHAEGSARHALAGKHLSIVGSGNVVQLTAQMARALDVDVMVFDPACPPDHPISAGMDMIPAANLDILLTAADIVWLHAPETDAKRDRMSRERLFSMKKGAVLINTTGPDLVDPAALAETLRGGHLAGAAIDMFSENFLPAGSPLAGAPNLVLTPRVGGFNPEISQRASHLIAERVGDHLASYCRACRLGSRLAPSLGYP